jgi:hypothetical protein
MSEFTEEQKLYINYEGYEDTKLIACAGSGKTKCIISRIDKSIGLCMFKDYNILMLTFSRFTKDDFLTKIKKYNAVNIQEKYISTIDSFAKTIIDDNNEIDVSLLSYRFMKYLEYTPKTQLKKHKKLNKIKAIYIDEAQDLNETQYKIFILLKEKLGIILNFVGDPNQNIYQFRASSDKYFVEFKAKIFYLTYNFRSHESIIYFSKFLRPNNNTNIVCALGENNTKPVIIFHENDFDLEILLTKILQNALDTGIDLSDIAILSPTRGRMRGYGNSHGLCLISNILYKAGIKFLQFYEESTDEINNISYKPQQGHINVLTFMGSKGLEWKYVILIDVDTCLINKRIFNDEKHKNDQFLLYVACSRAIDNMVIFSRYKMKNGEPDFRLNKWFSLIPKNAYHIDTKFKNILNFKDIRTYDLGLQEFRITKIIDKMNESTLDNVATLCNYGNGISTCVKEITKIYSKDFVELEQFSNIFLGKYVENLFYAYFCIHHAKPKKHYLDIENIINIKYIITDIPSQVAEWYYNNRNQLTWEYFDQNTTLSIQIKEIVNKKFSRECKLGEHTIVNDGYFKSFILSKTNSIKKNYEKYLTCTDCNIIKEYLFEIIIMEHSLDTQHYFHVKNKGMKFKFILTKFNELFDNMNTYIKTLPLNFINHNILIKQWDLIGEIDLLEKKNNKNIIWEIKCTKEITLKNVLQVLMYNLMNDLELVNTEQDKQIDLNFINILKGQIIIIKIMLSQESILKIIDIFMKTSLLK